MPIGIGRKATVVTDKGRHPLGRQSRHPVDEREVQSYAKLRQPPCAVDGIGCRRRADHETCAGENSVPMRAFDGLVHGNVESEVVSRNDYCVGQTLLPAGRVAMRCRPSAAAIADGERRGATRSVPFGAIAKALPRQTMPRPA